MKGEGKGWAKGRNAATDARIARAAAAHRGRTYVRHLSAEEDRRYRHGTARTLPLEWSDAMAYVVGLMATDGCLISNRRHLNFKSQDEQLVRTFLQCLGRPMRYGTIVGRTGNLHYVAQFGDVRFYRWLEDVGLTPRKSLTLGALDVPDAYLFPTVRGLFDGDGNIQNFTHRPTLSTYPEYTYERLWVFFNSASRVHLEWVRARVEGALGLCGYLEQLKTPPGKHDFFRLKYGKHASIALLHAMYPQEDVPKLQRKWTVWNEYRVRCGIEEACSPWNSVPTAGLEPAWAYAHTPLKRAPKPIRLRRREVDSTAPSEREQHMIELPVRLTTSRH